MADSNNVDQGKEHFDITRRKEDVRPPHYTLKIECFSQLSNILIELGGTEKYESGVFESGGYKWKLLLYPHGNKKGNANGHISLYLAMADAAALNHGSCELKVRIKFFVFDHIRDKYLTVDDGRLRCYHPLRLEHGFHQLLPLSTFNNSSNGYLVDDSCEFGVEVDVISLTDKGEKFSIIKEPSNGTYTWKVEKFSTLKQSYYNSPVFPVGQGKWKLKLYPEGNGEAFGKGLSLYLELNDSDVNLHGTVYAEYTLSIKDQVGLNHHMHTATHLFKKDSKAWGWPDFIELIELGKATKHYLMDDTIIVEAKISLISSVDALGSM